MTAEASKQPPLSGVRYGRATEPGLSLRVRARGFPAHRRYGERCTVPDCRCEGFMHDEESWAGLAEDMAGRTDEVLDAVSRSLDRPA